MNTDPIADFLTRIRNAISAKHRIVEIPSSNIKKEITRVLHEKGFITNYKFEDDSIQGKIKIALKYNAILLTIDSTLYCVSYYSSDTFLFNHENNIYIDCQLFRRLMHGADT